MNTIYQKKEARELQIRERQRIFEMYLRDLIDIDEYAKQMSNVSVEEL